MKITEVVCAKGRTGFFFDDQRATKRADRRSFMSGSKRMQENNLYGVYLAPRGRVRMVDLGMQIAQQYLSPFDHIIGVIGDAGSGKSMLIKGMFPCLDLTNDDGGVNVRPLPLLEIKITVAPKGFGSENMSALRMFKPSQGLECIKKFILETVETAGLNPCPSVVVGVGIGGTFDKAALLAKKALMRPVDVPSPDPFYAQLEEEMLEKINRLGIGPQGFGGKTTAIGVNIETMPTHIAGMPCAVNMNCHVTRHKTEII